MTSAAALNAGGATDALSSLGGDLTFAVAWAISSELLAAARDAQIGNAELIASVFCIIVSLNALPSALVMAQREVVKLMAAESEPASGEKTEEGDGTGELEGVVGFIQIFLKISQRISLSVCVQLLTNSVVASASLRSVRILSLLSATTFFLFLESSAQTGKLRKK